MAPSLDAVLEVGHLPIAADRLIGQARQQVSERPSPPGHHRILSGLRFERLQHGIKSEPGIGTGANLPDVGWDVGEAGVEELDAALPPCRVSGAEFGIPQVSGVSFDAEQGVIGAFASVARVVADFGTILVPKVVTTVLSRSKMSRERWSGK